MGNKTLLIHKIPEDRGEILIQNYIKCFLETDKFTAKNQRTVSRADLEQYIDVTKEEWSAINGYKNSQEFADRFKIYDYRPERPVKNIVKKSTTHEFSRKYRKSVKNGQMENTISYQEYLKTDHWLKLRDYVIKMSGNRCKLCNSTQGLQVHHRTYKYRGNAVKEIDDLICLCLECHHLFHNNMELCNNSQRWYKRINKIKMQNARREAKRGK